MFFRNPSVLEHYMTSLRDPMFWKLNKKIVDLLDNALKVLPPYTKNELYFPGVEVVNVEVKKMMTSFDYFEFDITDALKIGNGNTTFQVKIGQPRLSHKPFTMKISISSLVTQKGMVKVYLGPKVMPGEFSKNKHLFSLLDSFDISLKKGANVVTRSSEDITHFSPDFMSLQTLRKKVEDAQFGLDSLSLNSMNSQIQYPARMVLPKGTPEGLPLQLFVLVAPYMKTSLTGLYSATSTDFNEAIMSKLYPLDLPIDDNMLIGLTNIMFKDITVTYKGVGNGSASGYVRPSQPKAWSGGQFGQDLKMPLDTIHQMVQNDSPVQETKQTLSYNYASKNNGDYKTKYPYDKSDYSSYKKFDYKKINKDVTVETTNVLTEVPFIVPTQIPDEIKIINMPDTVDYDTNSAPFEMQNDDTVERTKQMLYYDYSSKNNVNYKSKQPYQNSDYLYKKTDYKNFNIDTTVKPKNNPTHESVDNIVMVKNLDTEILKIPDTVVPIKNDIKIDEIKTDLEDAAVKDVDNTDILKVLQLDENKDEIKLVPLLKLSQPKQVALTTEEENKNEKKKFSNSKISYTSS